MSRTVEAKAIISAEDRASAIFDRVAGRLRALASAASGMRVADNMARGLADAAATARRTAEQVDRLAAATARLNAAQSAGRGATGAGQARDRAGEVERLAAAYARLGEAQRAALQAGRGASGASGAREWAVQVERLAAAYQRAGEAQRAALQMSTPASRTAWIAEEIARLRELQRVRREVFNDRREPGSRPERPGRPSPAEDRPRSRDERQRRDLLPRPQLPSAPGWMPTGADVRGWAREGFDAAATIPQVQAQFRMRRESEDNIGRATRQAQQMARDIPEFSTAQHLQSIYQLLSIFGNMDQAMREAPGIARSNALIEGLQDQYRSLRPYAGGTLTRDFARIPDIIGVTDNPQRMQAILTAMMRGVLASAGDVTPTDYLGAIKYLRTARYNLSDDFLQNYLPGIIGDAKFRRGGATSAGTGLAAMFDQLYNLRATNPARAELERMGLTTGEFERNSSGRIIGRGQANIVRPDLFRTNPFYWATQVLIPAIERRLGRPLTGDEQQDAGPVSEVIGRITSNRVAADFLASMILQRGERERDARVTRGMPDPADALATLRRDAPATTLQALAAATNDFLAALAGPGVGPAVAGMRMITGAMRGFVDWQRENPTGGAVVSGIAGAGLAGIGGLLLRRAWRLLLGPATAAGLVEGAAAGAGAGAGAAAGGGGLAGLIGGGLNAIVPAALASVPAIFSYLRAHPDVQGPAVPGAEGYLGPGARAGNALGQEFERRMRSLFGESSPEPPRRSPPAVRDFGVWDGPGLPPANAEALPDDGTPWHPYLSADSLGVWRALLAAAQPGQPGPLGTTATVPAPVPASGDALRTLPPTELPPGLQMQFDRLSSMLERLPVEPDVRQGVAALQPSAGPGALTGGGPQQVTIAQPIPVQVTGEATVRQEVSMVGEFVVRGNDLIAIVRRELPAMISRLPLMANGPGSTGISMPESAPVTGTPAP